LALPNAAPANEKITASDYDVEMPLTLVIGDHRIMGMAGAYTSIAEGSGSSDFNPASFALRHRYSTDDWDWDWHLDWLSVGLGAEIDLENNGVNTIPFHAMGIFRLGLSFQVDDYGFGLGATTYQYTIPWENQALQVKTNTVVIGYGWNWMKGQLAMGVNLVGVSLEVARAENKDEKVKYAGATLSVGAVYRPENKPWRAGAIVTAPIGFRQEDEGDAKEAFGLILPATVRHPFRLSVGYSYYWAFGDSQYNQYYELNKTREPVTDRRYFLLSADVVFDGPTTERGTGLQGFAAQAIDPAGSFSTLSLRVGMESEVFHNRFKLRAGSYIEPSRFEGESFRIHGTAGLEMRLFKLWGWDWRIATTIDGARDYQNLSVGVGFWH
jgi:hypothetical protein